MMPEYRVSISTTPSEFAVKCLKVSAKRVVVSSEFQIAVHLSRVL